MNTCLLREIENYQHPEYFIHPLFGLMFKQDGCSYCLNVDSNFMNISKYTHKKELLRILKNNGVRQPPKGTNKKQLLKIIMKNT